MNAHRAPATASRKRKKAKVEADPFPNSLEFAAACEGVCRVALEMKLDNERRKGPAKELSHAKKRVTDTFRKLGITDVTDIPVPPALCDHPCTIELKQTKVKPTWEKDELVRAWVTSCGITPQQAEACYHEEYEAHKTLAYNIEVVPEARKFVGIESIRNSRA